MKSLVEMAKSNLVSAVLRMVLVKMRGCMFFRMMPHAHAVHVVEIGVLYFLNSLRS